MNTNTVYVIGESRTNMDNAITSIYNSFYMAFEIDSTNNEIIDVGCTHTIKLTEKFVRNMFLGKNMYNIEEIESDIKKRYHGTSQKAIIVSYKDALKKYEDVKRKLY